MKYVIQIDETMKRIDYNGGGREPIMWSTVFLYSVMLTKNKLKDMAIPSPFYLPNQGFFYHFQRVMPCEECKEHLLEHLQKEQDETIQIKDYIPILFKIYLKAKAQWKTKSKTIFYNGINDFVQDVMKESYYYNPIIKTFIKKMVDREGKFEDYKNVIDFFAASESQVFTGFEDYKKQYAEKYGIQKK